MGEDPRVGSGAVAPALHSPCNDEIDSMTDGAPRMRTDGANWEGPLFVIGMPRSGTKLLRNLLDRHPRIRILPWETDFLPFIDAWVASRGEPRTEAELARLASALRKSPYFDYRQKARGPLSVELWHRACRGRFDAAGLFEGFVRAELEAEPGSGVIWGDKTPGYVEHVDTLTRLFPRARLIHIVRDVRDYCLSMRESFGKDMRRAAHRWNDAMLRIAELVERGTPALACVHYEALLTDPSAELGRLCNHLGVEFTESMLALDRPVENHGSTKGRTGIVSTNLGRWRRALEPRMVREIESIAWDAMHALGYEPELARGPRSLNRPVLELLRVKDGLTLITRDVEKRGLVRSAAVYLGHYLIRRRPEAAP